MPYNRWRDPEPNNYWATGGQDCAIQWLEDVDRSNNQLATFWDDVACASPPWWANWQRQAVMVGGQRFDTLCICQAAAVTAASLRESMLPVPEQSLLTFLGTWEGLHSYYVLLPEAASAAHSPLSWAGCWAACDDSTTTLRSARMLAYGSHQERLFVLAALAAFARGTASGKRICLDPSGLEGARAGRQGIQSARCCALSTRAVTCAVCGRAARLCTPCLVRAGSMEVDALLDACLFDSLPDVYNSSFSWAPTIINGTAACGSTAADTLCVCMADALPAVPTINRAIGERSRPSMPLRTFYHLTINVQISASSTDCGSPKRAFVRQQQFAKCADMSPALLATHPNGCKVAAGGFPLFVSCKS